MYNELTPQDIAIMQRELDEKRPVELPAAIEEVKRTRAFGDLSENYEYKAAKQAQRRNDSRMRYLQNMIKTAQIIDDAPKGESGTAKLFDKLTVYLPEDDEEMVIQVVSTVRIDPNAGFISMESPLGKAVLGKCVGDKAEVYVNDSYSYEVVLRAIESAEDDGTAPLMNY